MTTKAADNNAARSVARDTIRSRLVLEVASEMIEQEDWPNRQARVSLRPQGAAEWAVNMIASDGPAALESGGARRDAAGDQQSGDVSGAGGARHRAVQKADSVARDYDHSFAGPARLRRDRKDRREVAARDSRAAHAFARVGARPARSCAPSDHRRSLEGGRFHPRRYRFLGRAGAL